MVMILHSQPFPTLETQTLTLRKVERTDAAALFDLRSNDNLMQYLNRPKAKTIDDALTLIQRLETDLQTGAGITWGLAQKGDATLIGTIGFWRIDAPNYRAEIGYLLHGDYHGRGWMDAAIKTVVAYGFEQLGLHSIEARIDPRNTPSARVLEKNHFVQEAHFKENIYQDGAFADTVVYSLLNPAQQPTKGI